MRADARTRTGESVCSQPLVRAPCVVVKAPEAGSMRQTSSSSLFAAQRAPAPTATQTGEPGSRGAGTGAGPCSVRVDLGDGLIVQVAHPDNTVFGDDAPGPPADADPRLHSACRRIEAYDRAVERRSPSGSDSS